MRLPKTTTLFAFACLSISTPVLAGFLEMPDTQEVPAFEEKTLRLDLDIPNVRERDPDPQGGPRLNVREFRVQGIVEYPELGVTREELIKRVEAIRFDIMKEDKVLESGYTEEELAELSDLLAEIEEETKGEHVTPVEVQRLVFLIREQRRNRGVTIGMIETVADVITRYYREAGFILAKAYIPEQQVREGVVVLTLLLGELGEVDVHENKRHSDRIISRAFNSAMAKPVAAKDIEQRLYLVNDMPGLTTRGFFEPGTQIGDTKLNVTVTQEEWYDVNIRADNHGAPGSGEYRLYSDVFLYSPFGLADQLQVGVLRSFEPMNSTYGLLRYTTNIIHPRLSLYAGASTNDFVLDQTFGDSAIFSYEGESFVVDAGLTYKIKRSRVSNHAIDVNATQIDSEIGVAGQPFGSDKVRNYTLNYNFDLIQERARLLHQVRLGWKQSNVQESTQTNIPSEASIFEYDYALLTFLPLPFTQAESRLLLRTAGAYSDTRLASSVQFGLGGPTRARAFDVNKFYADYGTFIGIDWQFNGIGGDRVEIWDEKLRDILQPYLLADYSYGYKYPLLNSDEDAIDAQFTNIGAGIKFSFKGMRGSLSYAKALVNEISSEQPDETPKESKVYFDLQYSF